MNQVKLEETLNKVNVDYEIYNDIIDSIRKSYCEKLDTLVISFNNKVIVEEADDSTLEKFLFQFGVEIYQLSSKLEQIGMKEDISKIVYKEIYNTSYLNSREKDGEKKNKLTVAELVAIAEQSSNYECIVNMLYDRLYSEMKIKISSANEIVSSIRKVITRRMQQDSFSFSDSNCNNLPNVL